MTIHQIGSVELHLTDPVIKTVDWIGQHELLEQLLACWTMVTDDDLPLCPRIVGQPGMGKTTLAQAAAGALESPAYIFQCTMDTRPEDLLVTPVLTSGGNVTYHASGLVTAMITGGVAILDEANRMSEKSWASLAPLLDNRRYAESLIAGARIDAHRDFRCCVTMNQDASTFEVPEYIISRLQPMIEIDFPPIEEERQILQYNVRFAPEDLLDLTAGFLEAAHKHRLSYSTRDGVNIMRYALKLRSRDDKLDLKSAFDRAAEAVLGEGAQDFETRARGMFMEGNIKDIQDLYEGFDLDGDWKNDE